MGQTAQNPIEGELKGYEIVSQDIKNNITYLKHKEGQEQIMVRKWVFNQKQAYERCLKMHEGSQLYKCPNIQKLKKILTSITEDLCTEIYELYALWEFHENSLGDEIQRRLNNNKNFTQKQMWSIAASCIQALEEMNSSSKIHQKLSVVSIKMDSKGNVKMCDPLSIQTQPNFIRVFTHHQIDRIYLSPEQCSALQTTSMCVKSSKNDVWALGLILLELGLLEDQNNCYLEQCRKVNQPKIAENLTRLGKMYSQNIVNLVESMLNFNKKDRPTWPQLKQYFLSKQLYQSVPKPTQCNLSNITNINKQSPQVFSYHSSRKQPQVYSFSKNVYPPPPLVSANQNIYSHPQQQNMQIFVNKIPPNNVFMAPAQQQPTFHNKVLVNFGRPEIRRDDRQVSVYNGPPVQVVNQNIPPNIIHVVPQRPNLYPFPPPTHVSFQRPPQMRKFTSLSSSQGYLFTGIANQKQKQLQQKKTEMISNQLDHEKLAEINKYDYNNGFQKPKFTQIQNTQSITYESQSHHALIQKHKQASQPAQIQYLAPVQPNKETGAIWNPLPEKANGGEGKLFPVSPIQAMKNQYTNEDQNKQQKLEFVIENFKVGSKYEGYKLKNMRHGAGKFYYQDGGMYDGNWQFNKMNGKGLLYYQSGALAYDGNWKNDQFQGKGKLFNESPESLHGSYDFNNFDNVGQCWSFYDGQFQNDMKQGRGKLMLTNGQYFIGNFNQDMIEGSGKFFGKKGVVKGVWQSNHLIKIQ